MDREIKFRGKRIDTQEWVYGFPVMVNGGWFMLPFGTPMTQHAYYSDRSCYGIMSSGDVKDLVGHDVQEDNGARTCQVISGTVGQYTGLKDKNGVEIFEGDVLAVPEFYETPEMTSTRYFNHQVVFVYGAFHLAGQEVNVSEDDYNLFQESRNYDDRFEVIGNVFDNPELINQ